MHLVLCSFGITLASVVPPPSLVVVLVLLVLSIVLPFALSFMLVSFVCLLHQHLLCWHLSCGGAVCCAGVFVVLVLVTHGTGVLVWCLPCWYLLWVWVCRAGVAFVLLVFVVGSAGLFALKKRNISVE